jgi:DNA-binding NtrC family response regulator
MLTDGTYRDVLVMRPPGKGVRVVVVSRLADWHQYVEALHEGAFDVIGSPCELSDVVWILKQPS